MNRRKTFLVGATLVLLGGVGVGAAAWQYRAEILPAPLAPSAFVPESWRVARTSDGHSAHLGLKDVTCDKCHAIDEEGFKPPESGICVKCHKEVFSTIHEFSPIGNQDCKSCHGFGTDRSVEPKKCLRCHDQPQGFVQAIEVHSGADCTSCHDPHAEPSLVPRTCVDCHEDVQARHAGREIAGTTLCRDCHEVHGDSGAADRRCAGCHQDDRVLAGKHALFPGHDKCSGCHQPHDFTVRGETCRSCHTDQRVLAVSGPVAVADGGRRAPRRRDHQACASCHEPHDVTRAGDRNCAGCHGGVKPAHPAAGGGRCLGCHPPHDKNLAGKAVATTCSSCHREARSDRAFHAAGKTVCSDCHRPHAFAAVKAGTVCVTCHKDQTVRASRNKGHADCAGCHKQGPHAPAAPPAECGSCHGGQRTVARRGHDKCATCHEPHGGDIRPQRGCTDCHKEVAASVPKGHANCRTCHEQHSGKLLARAATCTSCHKLSDAGQHAGVKGGCATCHRPHGPEGAPGPGLRGPAQPPACATAGCHKPAALPGVHQFAEHLQKCTACHGPHEKAPRADRATCLSCHKDQVNHEPTARVCNGCHVFKAAGP